MWTLKWGDQINTKDGESGDLGNGFERVSDGPFTKSEVQKKLMLERFGEENPGFDFSGANFLLRRIQEILWRCKV